MNRKAKDPVTNWIKSANYDIKTAEHMFDTGRYVYVIFMCHLSVEKLLKALYEAVLKDMPPKTHNLVFLSKAANLEIPEAYVKLIESLNDLSIVTRYPEDIDDLVKAFRKDRAGDYLKRTKGFLRWLKKEPRLKR